MDPVTKRQKGKKAKRQKGKKAKRQKKKKKKKKKKIQQQKDKKYKKYKTVIKKTTSQGAQRAPMPYAGARTRGP